MELSLTKEHFISSPDHAALLKTAAALVNSCMLHENDPTIEVGTQEIDIERVWVSVGFKTVEQTGESATLAEALAPFRDATLYLTARPEAPDDLYLKQEPLD